MGIQHPGAAGAAPGGLRRVRTPRTAPLRRGTGAARAAAHGGAVRHPGIYLRAVRPRAAVPAGRQSVLLRSVQTREGGRAARHPHTGIRDRCRHFPRRRIHLLRAGPESPSLRPRAFAGTGSDHGRRRRDQERNGGIHRAGGDGSRHRLLVGARRSARRFRARRRDAGARNPALRDRRGQRVDLRPALSGRGRTERERAGRRRRRSHRRRHVDRSWSG